jgi:epoxyqueuosine reductase
MKCELSAADIKARAVQVGFDACGIAPVGDHPELGFLSDWIARGYSASMEYLVRSAAQRADVRHVLPSARSVVVTATLYNTDHPYSTECADSGRAHVARYAWGEDYHGVIRGRLEALLAWMCETSPTRFEARVFVDTGPIQERVYAQSGGVGWIGKNTCVIHPGLGSWILLGEIVCSLPLDPDPPSLDQCGTCTLCLDGCPTHAIVAPGVLDSSRCISYLTIEHRGDIPAALRAGIGAHVFGCDVCQEVCPWNQSAPVSVDPAWQPRPVWDRPRLADLVLLGEAELMSAVKGSAMKRATVGGLRRNFAVARENQERPTG